MKAQEAIDLAHGAMLRLLECQRSEHAKFEKAASDLFTAVNRLTAIHTPEGHFHSYDPTCDLCCNREVNA